VVKGFESGVNCCSLGQEVIIKKEFLKDTPENHLNFPRIEPACDRETGISRPGGLSLIFIF